MASNGGWQKASPGSTHNFDEVPELQGTYLDKQEGVGSNNSNIYSIETEDGVVNFWGSAVIDSNFKGIKVGEEVKIEYKGMKKNPKTNRQFKEFEIFHRPATKSKDDGEFPI